MTSAVGMYLCRWTESFWWFLSGKDVGSTWQPYDHAWWQIWALVLLEPLTCRPGISVGALPSTPVHLGGVLEMNITYELSRFKYLWYSLLITGVRYYSPLLSSTFCIFLRIQILLSCAPQPSAPHVAEADIWSHKGLIIVEIKQYSHICREYTLGIVQYIMKCLVTKYHLHEALLTRRQMCQKLKFQSSQQGNLWKYENIHFQICKILRHNSFLNGILYKYPVNHYLQVPT
jgi:hypothetical protein